MFQWGSCVFQSYFQKLFLLLLAAVFGWGIWLLARHGYFLEPTRVFCVGLEEKIAQLIKELQPAVEPYNWLIGVLSVAIPGSWAIHKTLYYANRNLPDRAQEYYRRRDTALEQALPVEVRALRSSYRADQLGQPIAFVGPASSALPTRTSTTTTSIEGLRSKITDLDTQLAVEKSIQEKIIREKVAALVLLGIRYAAEATMNEVNSDTRKFADQSALKCFLDALALDPNSLDALELCGRQRARISDIHSESDFRRLEASARERGNAIVESRAKRLLAELEEATGIKAQLKPARRRLEEAIGQLKKINHRSSELTLELIDQHVALARVYRKLGLKSADQHLAEAKRLRETLPSNLK
jgi:tetratricopeptide (TPR) repeat protein